MHKKGDKRRDDDCSDHTLRGLLQDLICAIRELIESIRDRLGRKKVRLSFAFGLPTKKKETHMPVAVTITNEQQVVVTLNPVTDTGKPAKLDPKNPPKWTVVSGDSTVTPADDGLSATLVSSDTPGDTTFLVDADADLGDGVEDLQDTITLTVAGARATNLGISVGTPSPKP